ncbi:MULTISPECIES: hypothetical protein [unclassified Moorena]|uniref:hypothetical protein n=1 Tax=unclassified Moorena TaxID=2683338 RepID=UPI0013C83CEE|nr:MULTISPECIES: hypothetical protein [unclassified Moorena]NEO21006.1 hypothetical protein [Moorena sp. SIO4A5]NEQ58872.1 hypothetical protein [Moorena sp. SIO4A1]
MAKRPRASQQSGTSSIAFNLQPNNLQPNNLQPSTLAKRPRNRVQPLKLTPNS